MKALDRKTLRLFLEKAGDSLEGEWVLIGGTVLPLLGVEHRSTTDIDLIGLHPAEQAQSLALMELADRLGLPVETINQAGGFFLSRLPGFENELVLLHQGKTARIFRPNATLYLLLKLRRMSESDLQDCQQWLSWTKTQGETIDIQRVLESVDSEKKRDPHPERVQRLDQIRTFLKSA
jgi:hypothetical protein